MGRVRDLILSGKNGGQMPSITAMWFGEEFKLNFQALLSPGSGTGPEKAHSVPE